MPTTFLPFKASACVIPLPFLAIITPAKRGPNGLFRLTSGVARKISCRCTICTGLTRTKGMSFRTTSATRSITLRGTIFTGCPSSVLKYLPNSPHVVNASFAPLRALTPNLISACTTVWLTDNKKTKPTIDPRSNLNIFIALLTVQDQTLGSYEVYPHRLRQNVSKRVMHFFTLYI